MSNFRDNHHKKKKVKARWICHLNDSFLSHVDSVAICAEAACISNVGCEVGQTQNEIQFPTSKHYINHPIGTDTNYRGIWTNKSVEFIPTALPDRTTSYRSSVSKPLNRK